MARALAAQAERMADAVRHNLSDPPGSGGHDEPWRQTGALHDSVGATAEGLQAAVGSSDPAKSPWRFARGGRAAGVGHAHDAAAPVPGAGGSGHGGGGRPGGGRAGGGGVVAETRSVCGWGEADSDDAGDATPRVIQASATMPDAGVALLGLGAAALGYLILKDRVPKASPSHPPGPTVLEHSPGEGEDTEGAKNPPPGSKPINQTPWSGNHQEIKEGINAAPKDDTRISPDGNVWSQHPDGSWTNYGPASSFTGSGRPKGRRGKDRR